MTAIHRLIDYSGRSNLRGRVRSIGLGLTGIIGLLLPSPVGLSKDGLRSIRSGRSPRSPRSARSPRSPPLNGGLPPPSRFGGLARKDATARPLRSIRSSPSLNTSKSQKLPTSFWGKSPTRRILKYLSSSFFFLGAWRILTNISFVSRD
jgi:hypothetical protein